MTAVGHSQIHRAAVEISRELSSTKSTSNNIDLAKSKRDHRRESRGRSGARTDNNGSPAQIHACVAPTQLDRATHTEDISVETRKNPTRWNKGINRTQHSRLRFNNVKERNHRLLARHRD